MCSIYLNTGFGQDLAKPLQQQIPLLQDGLKHPGLDQVNNETRNRNLAIKVAHCNVNYIC